MHIKLESFVILNRVEGQNLKEGFSTLDEAQKFVEDCVVPANHKYIAITSWSLESIGNWDSNPDQDFTISHIITNYEVS